MRYESASSEEILEHFKKSSRAVIHACRKKYSGSRKIERAYVAYKLWHWKEQGGPLDYEMFTAEDILWHHLNRDLIRWDTKIREYVERGNFIVANKIADAKEMAHKLKREEFRRKFET